jgi:hypothetical protein
VVAVEAVMTRIAGDVVSNRNPVTRPVTIHVLANLDDLSSDLMTKDEWGLVQTVPFHTITAAQTACLYAHQQFVRADLWNRPLFDADIAVIVPHGNSHRWTPSPIVVLRATRI